ADVIPADREDRSVGDGDNRRTERREEIVAVVPAVADVAASGPVGVAERDVARHRERVRARAERRRAAKGLRGGRTRARRLRAQALGASAHRRRREGAGGTAWSSRNV